MMRVLVCGGRNFGERSRGVPKWTFDSMREDDRIAREIELLTATLDSISIAVLIHGAARGADRHADAWARRRGVQVERFHANWYPSGRAGGLDRSAGPIRNQRMIDEGRPHLVVAFPGGTGTADMVSRARAAGVKVVEIATAIPEPADREMET